MDTNTIQLLKECSFGCRMAMESVKKMREYAKDSELNHLLEAYGEKHRKLEGKISDRLKSCGEQESSPGIMAETMARAEMNVKMFMHPTDHEVAKIMMDGCNMGIQSVSEYVNKYPDASRESQDMAKELIGIEEDFMQEMKGFV
ncbi:MAG: PA2169 family four-helix-bundle protein [Bacteroidales bacterium]|nr:PA2169 family four-helix-bundle protein [Lachnoclostridium sp.]MCM1384593.1 PA2169 family four-helix-bundle protein [Lachnoclostridium sp.]MCM1465125.1 PA2169 family four-helix-bundle protein [Bacteroidales bacterium]